MFYNLSKDFIHKNLDDLLCQYTDENSILLYDESFKPESFTALEKLKGMDTLFYADVPFDEWIGYMLREQFIYGGVEGSALEEAVDCGLQNFKNLMEVCGETHQLYNPEVVDVLRRISIYTLTGELGENIDTSAEYNEFAHRIMPFVTEIIKGRTFSLAELLQISIISGLSGLDLKGSAACASALNSEGIAMRDLLSLPIEKAAMIYFQRLQEKYQGSNFPLFSLDHLTQSIEEKEHFELVWMTDDIIESYIDCLVLEGMLSSYKNISITLVPKNGRYGNDTNYEDACRMLTPQLKEYQKERRFRVCSTGPLMAAANLKKLSPECTSYIEQADALVLKGCRISEMFNGGLNAHSYVAFSVVRSITELETGFSSDSNSSVFFHLKPGEYAFWGVKGSPEIFESGRVYSTLKDHFSKIDSIDDAIERLQHIRKIQEVYEGDSRALLQELDQVAEHIHDYAVSRQ